MQPCTSTRKSSKQHTCGKHGMGLGAQVNSHGVEKCAQLLLLVLACPAVISPLPFYQGRCKKRVIASD